MNLDLNIYRDACSKCPEPVLFFDLFTRFALIDMNLEIIHSKNRPLNEIKKAKTKLKTYRQMVRIVFQMASRFGVSNDADFKAWYDWWTRYYYTLPQDERDRIKKDFLNAKPQDNWGRPLDNWH